ncbi:TIGR01244 family sulfur transferase [Qipengyuania mesophila]|uniref:TIGR01244 family sulfur transferase n=1 Tax=Qipengyuania mesophila TaxID=2867246 RepID=UPI0035159B9C
MTLSLVSERFAVAPQLRPEDLPALAKAGFRTLICNRPDGEENGQPEATEMAVAAEAAGMAFHHIPVSGGEFPVAAIEAFGRVRSEAEGKVLAYCRTGTRSITLDALANCDRLEGDALIERAREAGYDLSALRPRLGK